MRRALLPPAVLAGAVTGALALPACALAAPPPTPSPGIGVGVCIEIEIGVNASAERVRAPARAEPPAGTAAGAGAGTLVRAGRTARGPLRTATAARARDTAPAAGRTAAGGAPRAPAAEPPAPPPPPRARPEPPPEPAPEPGPEPAPTERHTVHRAAEDPEAAQPAERHPRPGRHRGGHQRRHRHSLRPLTTAPTTPIAAATRPVPLPAGDLGPRLNRRSRALRPGPAGRIRQRPGIWWLRKASTNRCGRRGRSRRSRCRRRPSPRRTRSRRRR